MPITVEKWVDEPIIVLKPDAQVSMQEIIDGWFRSTELAQAMEIPPHRVVDLRSINSPDSVVSMIRSVVMAMVGAPVDLPLNVSFVGKASPSSPMSTHCTETW